MWQVKNLTKKNRRLKLMMVLLYALPFLFIIIVISAFFLARDDTQQIKLGAVPTCAGASAEDFKCWRDRYQQMVAQQSPKEALSDADKNYKESSYFKSNCHQIVHVIGRAAGNKYEHVAEAYKMGGDLCWSGYYHGVLEAIATKIGPDKIVAQLDGICASLRNEAQYKFPHYNCVHGLGHGLMAVQNNELFQSLESCDQLNDQWERSSCYGGAFMENVMSEFNPDHYSKYLKNDEPLYPCTAVASKYKEQCYLMQTSHALKLVNYDFTSVFSLCEAVETPYNSTCFVSLGRDASGSTISDAEKTKSLCMLGTSHAAKQNCFVGAVKDFISFHHSDGQAMYLCSIINDAGIQNVCTATARAYYASF